MVMEATQYVWTALALLAAVVIMRRYQASQKAKQLLEEKEKLEMAIMHRRASIEPTAIAKELAALLPDKTLLAQEAAKMKDFRHSHWAGHNYSFYPECVIRPSTIEEVSKVVKTLSAEQTRRQKASDANAYFFAVRSGGHSPYESVLDRGVIVDMSAWNKIAVSDDKSMVTIGTGARWGDVTKPLETQGLTCMSGRDTNVGVGGLTLGGGISFYSPARGFVSSSVISFEVVLASGKIVTASADENSDLWNALKCGSSNFGIVTRITLPTFPSTKVWGGFVHALGFEAPKMIAGIHEWASRNGQGASDKQFDKYAASPLACFGYEGKYNVYAVAAHMLHTKPSATDRGWPACFKSTKFASMWRLWSSCKIQPMSTALEEITSFNPYGRRQIFLTTTVENDLDTLTKAHEIHYEAIQRLKKAKVTQMLWNFVMQPILPQWSTEGEAGPMGLSKSDKPLMIMHFCSSWDRIEDDEIIKSETRRAMKLINEMADKKGTRHPFLYLNYCGEDQKPFEGYGKENVEYLQAISRKYDEDGLFQKSCAGNFKLFDHQA